MARKLSTIAPDWWDYTTLDDGLIEEAARLTPADMQKLSRDGFRVVFYDTLEDFYVAEALEYITAWRQSTARSWERVNAMRPSLRMRPVAVVAQDSPVVGAHCISRESEMERLSVPSRSMKGSSERDGWGLRTS